jgi:hypothetical protein
MRRRRKSDQIAEVVIVKTDDGKTFRCSIVSTGHETQPHWALIDESAEQFLGPPVLPDHSPETVQRQIVEWWSGRNRGDRDPGPPKPRDKADVPAPSASEDERSR